MSLPSIKLGPKPTLWDVVAAAVAAIALVVAAVNWMAVQKQPPAASLDWGITLAFVLGQTALGSISLLVLGKTAKEGTIWGNLAAVGGMFLGLSGVLLATALWIAA